MTKRDIEIMIEGNLEYQLIEALEPIRHHVLATGIYHLFNEGIYDKLLESDHSIESLAKALHFDETKLLGFLRYLANEGIVEFIDEKVRLTKKSKQINEFRGWYTLMIGGYGHTYLQIGEKLKEGSGWAERDSGQVGVGSCQMSKFDAIPLTRSLMAEIPKECKYLLDVGCGEGLYLVEFCRAFPNLKAWGVEPSKGGYQAAVELVRRSGLEERIVLTNASALELLESPFKHEPDFLIVGYVLQEVLGQDGESGVSKFLTGILERFPDIYIIVIEIEDQITNKKIMGHSMSLAFYNPYYLLHYFTNQRLEKLEFWERLFEKCQLEVKAKKFADINVDSTDLTVGYLLHRKQS
ncbi:2-ketoarginine methyltransferase [Microcoleus sp. AR_TQ3_B6]|uniref:2-ketoarginine methyltransferase n=1 Tax=Microcoleus sp. AR_TQ3_B6 TaxID=3055284 RepID=UPI002FD6FEC2